MINCFLIFFLNNLKIIYHQGSVSFAKRMPEILSINIRLLWEDSGQDVKYDEMKVKYRET